MDGRDPAKPGYCPAQLLFQHPETATNPRWKAGDIIREAWTPDEEFLEDLRIAPAWLDRFPHELSGGELQRICLARALGPKTRYVAADEMTAMLDAVTQARIWKSVLDQAGRRKLGLLVISHDAVLLKRLCRRTLAFFSD